MDSAPRALTVVDGQLWTGAGAYANADHRGGTLVWTGRRDRRRRARPGGGPIPTYGNLTRVVYDGLVANRLTGGRARIRTRARPRDALPEPTDGGRTYVFTIRPDIRYSTGATVLPSDFVRGIERVLHPERRQHLPTSRRSSALTRA